MIYERLLVGMLHTNGHLTNPEKKRDLMEIRRENKPVEGTVVEGTVVEIPHSFARFQRHPKGGCFWFIFF